MARRVANTPEHGQQKKRLRMCIGEQQVMFCSQRWPTTAKMAATVRPQPTWPATFPRQALGTARPHAADKIPTHMLSQRFSFEPPRGRSASVSLPPPSWRAKFCNDRFNASSPFWRKFRLSGISATAGCSVCAVHAEGSCHSTALTMWKLAISDTVAGHPWSMVDDR